MQNPKENGDTHFLDVSYEIRRHRSPMATEESIAGLEDFDDDSPTNNSELPYERPKGSLRKNKNSEKTQSSQCG